MSEGFLENLAQSAIDSFLANGADVHLLTSELAYGATATEVSSAEPSAASYGSVTVAEADWTTTADSTNANITAENASLIDFGTAQEDWGTIVGAAITDGDQIVQSTDLSADITAGEDVSIEAGQLTFTLD